MLLKQCLVGAYIVLVNHFLSYNCQNSSYEDFVEMVRENLNLTSMYEYPINNEKFCYVKPSERNNTYDYGTFDFIIVGAGSAGTLLANRLTEIDQFNVLLLEAGGRGNGFSDIPGMAFNLIATDMNWGYLSTPQKNACLAMKNQQCSVPRGKVVGGSSTINAKMYVRGNKEDYDKWEAMGNSGWSYKDVLPYFIKTEKTAIFTTDNEYHSTRGLLDVNYTESTIFTTMFQQCDELGEEIYDYNGENQIGSSLVQFNIKGNKIASGERAFIDPIANRSNLNLTIEAFVTKLITNSNEEGVTVTGVEFIKNGKIYTVRACKEVILSAGSVNSPQILMLSGIGPAEELDKLDIDTLVQLPVGKYLEDHAAFIGITIQTNQTLFNDSLEVLLNNYLQNHRPYTAGYNSDYVSFLNVKDANSTAPDIQIIFAVPPGSGPNTNKAFNLNETYFQSFANSSDPYRDINVWVILLHPKSKGKVTLQSKNPIDFPLIDKNYYAEEEDVVTMLEGVKKTMKLLETESFRSFNATFVSSYAFCTEFTLYSDEYWRCMLKYMTTTMYHPVGTTRMGVLKNDSVVSSNLTVHDTKGLRVVDAGVMPKIPSGNVNAATYMIAEKAADIIKELHLSSIR